MKKTVQKQFGQFFTDALIARLMVRWALKNNAKNFLDPAVGPGIFPQMANELNGKIKKTVVEYEPSMIAKFKEDNKYNVNLVCSDYLAFDPEIKFDAIVCNPPYNKFQAIPNRDSYRELFSKKYGVCLSGYTNLCIYFLVKSINELGEGGRCCYIIPYEFLNTGYGVVVKQYLLCKRMLRGILKFDSTTNLFSDVITTSCILFIENKKFDGCYFINSSSIPDLEKFDFDEFSAKQPAFFRKYENLDCNEKWIKYFENKKKNVESRNLIPLSLVGKVKRGIATGSNTFFSLNRTKIKEFRLSSETCVPCVSKSPDIKTLIFDKKEFEKLYSMDKKVFLFNGEDASTDYDRSYIKHGEQIEVNKGFLTSHRTPWYALENKPPAPIWVSVFNRGNIKVIRNEAGVKNLTTFHGLYTNGLNEQEINILFCYLLTSTANRILKQNKREYGDGLDKFEPNDLNNSKIIDVKNLAGEIKSRVLTCYNQLKNSHSDSRVVIQELDYIFRSVVGVNS
ncbi:MAG: N-6 DNA methylase [Fibrobacter sp.]|nr:N-6 DNA methylase [Fibrobacter sp.]